MDANTVAMTPAGETAATQAFNPVTGQFEAVPNPQNGVSTKTRAEQRAEAAKARKKKQIIIGSVVGGLVALLVILGVFFMLNKSDSTATWWKFLSSPPRRIFPRHASKSSSRPRV